MIHTLEVLFAWQVVNQIPEVLLPWTQALQNPFGPPGWANGPYESGDPLCGAVIVMLIGGAVFVAVVNAFQRHKRRQFEERDKPDERGPYR